MVTGVAILRNNSQNDGTTYAAADFLHICKLYIGRWGDIDFESNSGVEYPSSWNGLLGKLCKGHRAGEGPE